MKLTSQLCFVFLPEVQVNSSRVEGLPVATHLIMQLTRCLYYSAKVPLICSHICAGVQVKNVPDIKGRISVYSSKCGAQLNRKGLSFHISVFPPGEERGRFSLLRWKKGAE